MSNIIHVDFRQARQLCEREAFLNLVAVELDELDFAEFVDAVNDATYYPTVDLEIQELVDSFFACKA
jgi:hypothetical protein